jgi:3-hydroxy-9,10-secoandrosta-1,3,5(10)-triene-9,17-dione monooxygenase reductase component
MPADVIEPDRLRRAFGMFATGVTIISAQHPVQGLVGMTVNSFTSVSLDPPLILFSLARTSYTLQPLLESPAFVVNILRDGQRALSHRFAHSGGEKWQGLSWRAAASGAPILAGCIAFFDCVHHAQYDGGDHIVLLGRVMAMDVEAEGEPLLYFHSRYRSIGQEIDI